MGPLQAVTLTTSSNGPTRPSIWSTAPTDPAPPSRKDEPTDATGDAPATPYAPARNASTRTTTPSSPACAATATGSGAPGNSKEQLRDLYRTVYPADARAYLKTWCTSALRSRIPAYRNLVTRLRKHFDAITAAVELGLSNGLVEGTNGKIRLIQRRGYGIRNIDTLISMIYLCLGGITITPPQHIDRHAPTKT